MRLQDRIWNYLSSPLAGYCEDNWKLEKDSRLQQLVRCLKVALFFHYHTGEKLKFVLFGIFYWLHLHRKALMLEVHVAFFYLVYIWTIVLFLFQLNMHSQRLARRLRLVQRVLLHMKYMIIDKFLIWGCHLPLYLLFLNFKFADAGLGKKCLD